MSTSCIVALCSKKIILMQVERDKAKMTNKKIIVKGCPALLNDDVVENGCFLKSVGDEDFFCKDYMDCKIKQFLQRLYSIVVNDAKTNQSCSVFFEFFNATRILDLQEVPE